MLSGYFVLCGVLTIQSSYSQLIYLNSAVVKFAAGFGIPINVEAPGRALAMAINIQALYRLPDNSSYFEPYKIVQKRSITQTVNRKLVYQSLEPVFEKFDMPGKDCVLRFICELAGVALSSEFGHLLHLIFTPIGDDVLNTEYMEAHQRGYMQNFDCYQLYNCTASSLLKSNFMLNSFM